MSGEHQSEPVQRVRIGLTGLAFVFLLVLLGTAISRSSEPVPPAGAPVSNVDAVDAPNDPMAEIGAAPGQSSGDDNSQQAAPSGSGARPAP